MKYFSLRNIVFTVGTVFLLSACGGGSDDNGGGSSIKSFAKQKQEFLDKLAQRNNNFDENLEPNDAKGSAYPIEIGEEIETFIAESSADTIDYYTFLVEKGKTYTLEFTPKNYMSGSGNGLTINIIQDPNDKVFFREEKFEYPGQYIREFTANKDDVLVFSVKAYKDTYEYNYKFKILPAKKDGLVQDPVTYEPNNSPSTAYPIKIGQEIDTMITSDLVDKVDYYTFPVKKGKTYTLEFTAKNYMSGSGNGLTLNIIQDPNDKIFFKKEKFEYPGQYIREFTANKDDVLVFSVKAYSGTYEYKYKFKFTEK